MARTVAETAEVLTKIYGSQFNNDLLETYRITWPQLRLLADVPKLDSDYISALNMSLIEEKFTIIPFDNFFVVSRETDFELDRQVPDRIIEKYLDASSDDIIEDEEDDEDVELGDE